MNDLLKNIISDSTKSNMLNALIDNPFIPLLLFDNKGTILFSNDLLNEIYSAGLNNNLNGKNISDILPDDDIDSLSGHLSLSIKKSHTRFNYNVKNAFHIKKQLDITLYYISKEERRKVFLAIINDITEKEKNKIAINRSEVLLRKFSKNLPDILLILFNKDFRNIIIDGKETKSFNIIAKEAEGKTIWETFPLELCEIFTPHFKATLNGKESSFEFMYNNKQYKVSSFPMIKETNEIYAGMVIIQNISVKHSFEEKVKNTIRKLYSILESINDGFISVDKNWVLKYINNSAEKIFQKPRTEMLGKVIWEEFYSLLGTKFYYNCENAVNQKTPITFEEKFSLNESWFEFHIYPFTEGLSIFFRDIEQRKSDQAKIQNYIAELERSKKLIEENSAKVTKLNNELHESQLELKKILDNKDKFFSLISHDLRSPFTSLLGMTNLLTEEYENMTDEEIKRGLENISNSSRLVFNLLENLLHWSRLQMNRIEFNPVRINLHDLIREIFILLKNNASEKEIELINNVPDDCEISADINMFHSVFQNLTSNSIKFTKNNGTITVSVKDSDDYLSIILSDTGIGIKKENISRLFKIGEHFSTLGTNHEKGTGLGLVLCKEMVEKNNGKIKVESEIGKGTTFIIDLPKNDFPAFLDNLDL